MAGGEALMRNEFSTPGAEPARVDAPALSLVRKVEVDRSRDALLTAVWGDVAVTDDSLTQCISEIRRALGPSAAGLLRTHARRGYIIATLPRAVVPAPVAPPPGPGAAIANPAAHPPRSRVDWAALAAEAGAPPLR